MEQMKVSDVVFRDDLYPRIEKSPQTVQKYAEDLSVLPPIEVNQRGELIDGWHRWTAHKKANGTEICISVTETKSDAEFLELAIERNAAHGLQLSQEDKQAMAVTIYQATPRSEQAEKKARLQKILSVGESTIREWLSRSDNDMKKRAKAETANLWLSCRTQEEIAEHVGWPRDTIQGWIADFVDFAKISESNKAVISHAVDFEPPIYNIWKQQKKTTGSSHFGNSEIRWVDNLLYLYTSPFDVVVDPFAGGGSTADICKKRFRRYWASDRKVEPELEDKIREWDITAGVPPLPRWKDVSLVYLDPPYWKQAEGKYSEDPTDLANMSLDAFNQALAGLIKKFAAKMTGGYIALLIQPTQWNAPDRQFTDHVADMLRAVKLSIDMRFSCPYESQQCNAQMVDWAKQNRKCLVLSRELIVWRV